MQGASHESGQVSASSLSKGCKEVLQATYLETYYPTIKMKCAACHTAGPGISYFAQSDSEAASAAFLNTGIQKINMRLLDSGHGVNGSNGPVNQPLVDKHASTWSQAVAIAESCQLEKFIHTRGKNTAVRTVAVTLPANQEPNRDPWRVLEWDLFSEMVDPAKNGKIHMVIAIQYRVGRLNGVQVGYDFRNPTARIRAGAPAGTQYLVENLKVYQNGFNLNAITAFEAINAGVMNVADTPLITGGASTAAIPSFNIAADQISIRFGDIQDATGQVIGEGTGGNGTGGGSPIPVPANVTFADLQNGGSNLGVFAKNCNGCHSGATPAAGLNLTDYTAAMTARNSIRSRVTDAGRPMPPTGLLNQFNQDVVSKWVDLGAPQN